ncbi:hypothetical protein PybrP1_011408 [[Pythium] brassicae (nom. inval.)]|nr:hypothetical protein PybrP1_011408 [[Pythium] brassicae (nom. inval.)]
MSARRYKLAEYALAVATGGLVASEHFATSFGSLQQLRATQLALAAIVAAAMAAHHPRREAAPFYVALLALVTRATMREPLRTRSDSALLGVATGSVALAVALLVLFPWPDLTRLHGPYQSIGVTTMRLGDVECRVLYPSAKAPSAVPLSRRASMLHHGEHVLKGMSAFTRMPQFLFGCLNSGLLAAIPNAPVATPETRAADSSSTGSDGGAKRWPLVVFSHGLGGTIDIYSAVTQQLASDGNIVVVVNHCDGSAAVTRMADGRIEYYQPISVAVRDNIDGAGFRLRNAQLRVRVQEVRRVLNAIALEQRTQAPGGVFAEADAASVSLVGHSFGAATAMATAHVDERIRCLVLLDAWMEPLDADVKTGLGPRVPVFHLLSEHFFHWDANMRATKTHAHGCSHARSTLSVLRGTRHNDFCDLPLFSPLVNRLLKSSGRLSPLYALQAISELSAAFLRGAHAQVIAQFPEVVVLEASAS